MLPLLQRQLSQSGVITQNPWPGSMTDMASSGQYQSMTAEFVFSQ
jgi:hypothetical protein